MKVSEMNARERKAFYNIVSACNNLIGDLENTIADNAETSEEYKEAKGMLENHELLVETLYEMATSGVYAEGFANTGAQAKKFIREINFCGKEWLMERCERRITKEGY